MTKKLMYDENHDENGILKDGHSGRCPVMLRDSAAITNDAMQRGNLHDGPVRVVDSFGRSDAVALSRPGYRFPAGGPAAPYARDEAIKADAAYIQDLENSWRKRRPDDDDEPEDDADEQTQDALRGLDAKEAAYQQHAAWLRDAWKSRP